MNFESTIRTELKTVPGLWITTKKMTEGRRIELRQAMRQAQEELTVRLNAARFAAAKKQEFEDQLPPIDKREGLILSPEHIKAAIDFDTAYRAFVDQRTDVVDPLQMKWGLVAVSDTDGNPVTVDGQPVTAANFTELMPEEVYDEALEIVKANGGLTDGQIKNSKPPTTSNEADGGQANGLTATSAANPDTSSTAPGTVSSSPITT